jgi:hypothetical protein
MNLLLDLMHESELTYMYIISLPPPSTYQVIERTRNSLIWTGFPRILGDSKITGRRSLKTSDTSTTTSLTKWRSASRRESQSWNCLSISTSSAGIGSWLLWVQSTMKSMWSSYGDIAHMCSQIFQRVSAINHWRRKCGAMGVRLGFPSISHPYWNTMRICHPDRRYLLNIPFVLWKYIASRSWKSEQSSQTSLSRYI